MSVTYGNNDEQLLAIIDDILAEEPFGSERHKEYTAARVAVLNRLFWADLISSASTQED